VPEISDADRLFLAHEYRWVEQNDPDIRIRHRGAREQEIVGPWMTYAGAAVALEIIHEACSGDKKLVIATVAARLSLSFKGRPRTVNLYHGRFGFELTEPRKMLCERATVDWGNSLTTLYLTG
jgi:hypothetical protein